jgi:biopolymer transport protein ExbD
MPARKLEWKRTKKDDGGDTPLMITPLIDIMFLLLIFFVMNTSFNKLTPLDINLPDSQAASGVVNETLTVTLYGNEKIKVNGIVVSTEDFSSLLKKTIAEEKADKVIIAGDETISYAFLVNVMDTISLSGLSDITLLTENQ